MAKKRDTVSLDDKDTIINATIDDSRASMNNTLSTITQSIKNTTIAIGSDIKVLQDSLNKANSDIIDAHNEINTLRRENKALSNALADNRSKVVILEENYRSLVDDLAKSAKIDLFIYTIFAVCIICLAYEVYILTH